MSMCTWGENCYVSVMIIMSLEGYSVEQKSLQRYDELDFACESARMTRASGIECKPWHACRCEAAAEAPASSRPEIWSSGNGDDDDDDDDDGDGNGGVSGDVDYDNSSDNNDQQQRQIIL
jgi:hypothetical protein